MRLDGEDNRKMVCDNLQCNGTNKHNSRLLDINFENDIRTDHVDQI